MKFETLEARLLIEYKKRKIFFFKNHAENGAGRLVPDFFLFFKKVLFEVKASGFQLRCITWHTIKTNYIKL